MDTVDSVPWCRKEGEHVWQRHIILIYIIPCTGLDVVGSTDNLNSNISHIINRSSAIGPASIITSQHGQALLIRKRHGFNTNIQPQQLREFSVFWRIL